MEKDWQDNIFRVEDRLAKLLEKELFADVSFSVCKKGSEEQATILRAHKLMLANASSVFEAMFYGPMAKKDDKPIQVEDFDSATFLAMLKYIYSNAVDLKSWDEAAKLYGIAKMYMLNALGKHCLDYIETEIKATNALKTYEFAKLYEEDDLMEAALKVIKNETLYVIHSPEFLEIDMSTMITILDQDELQASEKQLFDALESLAKAQVMDEEMYQVTTEDFPEENGAKLVNADNWDLFRTAVKKINFLDMSAEEFANVAAKSKLLSKEESLFILSCLVSPKINFGLYPKEFSQNIRKNGSRVSLNISIGESNFGEIFIKLKSDVPETVDDIFIFFDDNKCLQIKFRRSIYPLKASEKGLIFAEKCFEMNLTYPHRGFGEIPPAIYDYSEYESDSSIFIGGDEVAFGKVVTGMNIVREIWGFNKNRRNCISMYIGSKNYMLLQYCY